MSEGVFKAPKSKKSMEIEDEEHLATTSKRPRTAEDFYMFCKFILEYENYDMVKQEELREKSGSPIGSTGSLSDSIKSESTSGSLTPDDRKGSEVDLAKTGSQEWNWNGIHFSDEDSYDLITCFCLKPFAGRPMIECSKCLTWIHLSCAKIKKTNIPEVFICNKCKRQNHTVRRPSLRSISGSSPPVRMKKKVSV
ncbi:PHD finger protein 13-like isoform X1 [Ischnura elegans]|uniref:PHD finger protein 13-like isoform X1 n=1 Tax=Ischnura elegans TaxID=197161 RepID=UPI001ED88A32|nr:PHD finger protein 13-like isoform X1 [Ischnura elegans]